MVIARGKYDAAMDMWSVGCIFGELLQVRLNERCLPVKPANKLGCA